MLFSQEFGCGLKNFAKLSQAWVLRIFFTALGGTLAPKVKQTVGGLCFGKAQLDCPSDTLAEINNIMNILFVSCLTITQKILDFSKIIGMLPDHAKYADFTMQFKLLVSDLVTICQL